jgi:hypothetical protein
LTLSAGLLQIVSQLTIVWMSTAMGLTFWLGGICNYVATTVDRFSIFDFGFSIEELSSRLNPEAMIPSGFGTYGERILAGFKNFDFRGTIDGTKKSGQSEVY